MRVNTKTQGNRKQTGTEASPRLSVILCTYNRRNLALSALASLRRQTLSYDQFEVIVVDNGSSDGTLDAVRAYVSAGPQPGRSTEHSWQVQCLAEPQNGLAYARTTGLQAASGEIAVFLDDDTLADPYFLERLLEAYDETGADAIGGQVELRWEAPRPHWLSEDLLELLGHFAPANERIRLNKPAGVPSIPADDVITLPFPVETINCASTHAPDGFICFSSCSFSVKIAALRRSGMFASFLSKRQRLPTNLEVYDLCRRLHAAGYQLWYDPDAVVTHRVLAARLKRAFFTGRAYWQGRSEIILHYAITLSQETTGKRRFKEAWHMLSTELREIVALALYRPLLRLAARPSSTQLQAAMEQARRRGRTEQYLQLLEHAPLEMTELAVLLVHSSPPGTEPASKLLAEALRQQGVSCTLTIADIPLSWLWRHRRHHASAGRSIGIIHLYRPGMFNLTYRQRQRFWFRLWLARRWGIRIVMTDGGGWWQSLHGLRALVRRSLERRLLHTSDRVLSSTRQPEQLYPDKKLRRRVRCLPQPGLRGYYTPPLARALAHRQLGLPENTDFVYLCLVHQHTGRELLLLIEAFSSMTANSQQATTPQQPAMFVPQLLLVGAIQDSRLRARIIKRAASNPAMHLSMTTPTREEMPLYLGATDAIVLPHEDIPSSGTLETAMLALSYERIIVAPDLPRFRGMLPPRASLLYDPANQESFVQALCQARTHFYHLNEKEATALDATIGWSRYAQRLLKIYKQVLQDGEG